MTKKILLLLTFLLIFSLSYSENTNSEDEIIPITVDSLLIIAEDNIDNEIQLIGQVDHICRKSNKKLTLLGIDTTISIHILIVEDSVGFDSTLNGKNVLITGIIKEFKIDEEYLKKWEESLAETDIEEHDDEHIDHHKNQIEEINELREEINSNEKGYVSEFWIEYIDLEVKE